MHNTGAVAAAAAVAAVAAVAVAACRHSAMDTGRPAMVYEFRLVKAGLFLSHFEENNCTCALNQQVVRGVHGLQVGRDCQQPVQMVLCTNIVYIIVTLTASFI